MHQRSGLDGSSQMLGCMFLSPAKKHRLEGAKQICVFSSHSSGEKDTPALMHGLVAHKRLYDDVRIKC